MIQSSSSFCVVYAEFMHETNSFSLRRTGEAEFAQGQLCWGDAAVQAAFAHTVCATGAALAAAQRHCWQLHTPVVAEATPSGLVKDEWFERVAVTIENALAAFAPVHGVLLHLHGSMATESSHDADGDLLARLRRAVGPQVPIAVVLDLHATVTPQMVAAVQVLLPYRTYPHVDMAERMTQAADVLHACMRGEIEPVLTLHRPPLLYGCDGGRTTLPDLPMSRLLRQADTWEAAGDALLIAICAGFSSIDSPDIGPSVVVISDARQAQHTPAVALRMALRLCQDIWDSRDEHSIPMMPLPEAMKRAKAGEALPRQAGPLVLADHADNPGAGAYGDATAILARMLAADLQEAVFFALFDPQAAATAASAGVGSHVQLWAGGCTAPETGGGPIWLEGRVCAISDGHFQATGPMGGGVWRQVGLTVVVQVRGIAVVLSSSNQQANDLAQFTSLGLNPAACATVAVKSMQHFKAAFSPIAREILNLDSGGLCTRSYSLRPYQRVRRPIYPLDEGTTWIKPNTPTV